MMLKAPYLLDFRHKKGRPWTPLDEYLVEPGGFEPPVMLLNHWAAAWWLLKCCWNRYFSPGIFGIGIQA